MKKNIAVVYGGNSSEVEISVMSGRYVASVIDRELFNVYEVYLRGTEWNVIEWDEEDVPSVVAPICKDDFSFIGKDGENVQIDVACLMIHGTPGENGILQGYLEMIGIPFTTCSSFACTVAFNKYACKTFLKDSGVKMAREVFLRKGDALDTDKIIKKLSLPLFVKPADGGSSFGITKVMFPEQLQPACEKAFKEYDTILVEEFIPGREFTQGVYSTGSEIRPLPVTEIISNNEYFDYEAKYLGGSQEICPALISNELAAQISEISAHIYKYFGCKGVIRIDYIAN